METREIVFALPSEINLKDTELIVSKLEACTKDILIVSHKDKETNCHHITIDLSHDDEPILFALQGLIQNMSDMINTMGREVAYKQFEALT